MRQHRYALGRPMWEAPRGSGEPHDAAEEAQRELREETGADNVELVELGVVHPDSGTLTTEVALFAALLGADCPVGACDEADDAIWVPFDQLLAMVADGDITDGMTIAAVCRAMMRGLLPVSQNRPQQAPFVHC